MTVSYLHLETPRLGRKKEEYQECFRSPAQEPFKGAHGSVESSLGSSSVKTRTHGLSLPPFNLNLLLCMHLMGEGHLNHGALMNMREQLYGVNSLLLLYVISGHGTQSSGSCSTIAFTHGAILPVLNNRSTLECAIHILSSLPVSS